MPLAPISTARSPDSRNREAEKMVAQAEEDKLLREEAMADPSVYTNPILAAEVAKAYQTARQDTEKAYAAWENAEQALSEFEGD